MTRPHTRSGALAVSASLLLAPAIGTALLAAPAAAAAPASTATASAHGAPTLTPAAHDGADVRLAGADRYATAAAISRSAYPDAPVPVVHIVTGLDFADALAGGPAAAALGGPVLPVATDMIPEVVAAELERLQPGRVVVLGGTAAVSSAVEATLGEYTDGSVTRIAGADRYGTAAAAALAAFDGPVDRVLIATGLGFADALAGGAAGAMTASPVLLVRPDGIPAATAEALRRLQPADIAVLGGPAALDDAVVQGLKRYTAGDVDRLAGADRFGTAARVAAVFWPQGANTVYLATGLDYPDALAAVPAAGTDDAPVLLTRPDCLPGAAVAQLERLAPQTAIVVGGQNAVSDAALSRTCVQDLLLDLPAAQRAEPGDWRLAEPFRQPPLLDPCTGGTAYPRDADRVSTASTALETLREAGGTSVQQTLARYPSAAVAADAAAGYERAVRGCPGTGDHPNAARYEVLRSDQTGDEPAIVIRLGFGSGLYAQYFAVQQVGDLVSVLSVSYGEDGDPGVASIEPFLPEVTAALTQD